MKANIPDLQTEDVTPSKSTPSMELEGVYLRAMQDISARLMEALPAEESLWQTLAQTESLLLEAQLSGASLQDVFGIGGVAGFCQSIVDEYNQRRAGETRDIPAAHDPSIRKSRKTRTPRSDIMIRRKQRATVGLIAAFALIFAILAVWYSGLLGFWTKGSRYYLDELYHFSDTVTPVSEEPLSFTVALTPSVGLDYVLYTDEEGRAVLTLTEIYYSECLHEAGEDATDLDTEHTAYRKNFVFCVTICYPVQVGYTRITYIEPGTDGTATLTTPDGETMTFSVSASRSGSAGEGYEYVSLEIADLPASFNTEGITVSVTLEPPRFVEWNRIGVGLR